MSGELDPAQIEERLREVLEPRLPGLVAAYLFGSVARGEAGPGSDVDVAVLLEQAPSDYAGLHPLLDAEGALGDLDAFVATVRAALGPPSG